MMMPELLSNKPLIAAIIAWALAQLIKVILDSIFSRKLSLKSLVASGGMPSSHSSLVSALTTVIAIQYGLGSAYFAIAAVLSMVVMYDAFNVRRAAGEQAKAINKIFKALMENNFIADEKAMKEILGHSPLQVLAGFFLGLITGFIVMKF
jgi:acid phosphatase family membrane protein YuiD